MAENFRLVADVSKLARAFDAAPAKTRRTVEVQIKMAVRDVRDEARTNHRFVSRSGMTERSIESVASGNTGTVSLTSDIAVYQHEGTRAHAIYPRTKQALRFVQNRGFVFAKRVNHPGIKKDQYLYQAADKMEPIIVSRFSAALDGLLEG
jgi:hypothetical protein